MRGSRHALRGSMAWYSIIYSTQTQGTHLVYVDRIKDYPRSRLTTRSESGRARGTVRIAIYALAACLPAASAIGFCAALGVLAAQSLAAGDPSQGPLAPRAVAGLVHEASRGRARFAGALTGTFARLHDGAAPGGWTPVRVRAAAGPEGPGTVAWASPHGRYLFIGAVINRQGVNVTRRLAQAAHMLPAAQGGQTAAAAPSASLGSLPAPVAVLSHQAFWRATREATTGILQYRSGARHTLYVYFDPDCIFCHHLYDRLQADRALLKAGHVRVDWIPVAILHPGSAARADAILAGGRKVLVANETHFDVAKERGGAPRRVSPKETARLIANMKVFLHGGADLGTPTLSWRSAGGHAHYLVGLPNKTGLSSIIRSFGPVIAQH